MRVLAVPLLGVGSMLFETNQIELAKAANWKLGVGMLYTAVGTSIFAHGQYFRLLHAYDVSLIVPLTLMTPFWAVMLGALIRDEPLNSRFLLGATLILVSVFVIARRQTKSITEAT